MAAAQQVMMQGPFTPNSHSGGTNAPNARAKTTEVQLLVSYNASKNRTPYHTITPFTPSTRREQYTGQRFTTHASSLSALSSLTRELLEPVVAVDDVFIFVVDLNHIISQQLLVHGLLARGAAGDARLL